MSAIGRSNFGIILESAVRRDPSLIPFHKFGNVTNISTSTYETIWTLGGEINYPDSPAFFKISSSSVDDTDAGSGARSIKVVGLNEDGDLDNETVGINGRTEVTLTKKFFRVFRLIVKTTGTPRAPNTGTIYLYSGSSTLGVPDDTGQIYSAISAEDGQSLQSSVTIPKGKTGVLLSVMWSSNAKSDKAIFLRMLARENDNTLPLTTNEDSPFVTKDVFNLERILQQDIEAPVSFPELTDIELQAKAVVINTDASASMDFLFVT